MIATATSFVGVGVLAGVTSARAATTITLHLSAPMVGMAPTSDGNGYWTVGSDGGVFTFGDAAFEGSMGGRHLAAPVVGMAAGPTSGSYWEVASDGGVFSFGGAPFYGSMGGKKLGAPIVGMAVTPDHLGYWMIASDGGVFAFGDAQYFGSMGGRSLGAPVVAMASTKDGKGYWLVSANGSVYSFGDAQFSGSLGGMRLTSPIVSIAADDSTGGYWLASESGGVYSFDSNFAGSLGGQKLAAPIRTIVADPATGGYWLAGAAGAVYPFGGAPFEGQINGILPGSASPDVLGGRIASVAGSQVGNTDPFDYGPVGSGWCAYFASWVWRNSGLSIPPEAMAYEIGSWALANGGTLLPPTATPQVGDAVLFEPPGSSVAWPDSGGLSYPNIEHVNIVVKVLPGNQIITIGGNESGAVREQGPYSAADASSWWGQAIYGFVQPPGV